MRILVTNDDGIAAPGLDVLQTLAGKLSDDVWVVAPESDQSGVSRSLTLHEPLRCREVAPQIYAVKGTPADCVIMGTRHLLGDQAPDLVLSGVNRGQNIADDVHYSGTIAGAMEGATLGVPSLALSLATRMSGPDSIIWDMPLAHGVGVIQKLLKAGWDKHTVLNINFPDCPPHELQGTMLTRQGKRSHGRLMIDERHDTWGRPYYWFDYERQRSKADAGTDIWAIYNNWISVTPLKYNLTDDDESARLADKF
ncbi:MAG: 5'/3'-nucleotidase SurE [Hyphomicrobiaceae bacterium]